MVIGAKSLNAPFLKVSIELPFEVVPSGKMANGNTYFLYYPLQ